MRPPLRCPPKRLNFFQSTRGLIVKRRKQTVAIDAAPNLSDFEAAIETLRTQSADARRLSSEHRERRRIALQDPRVPDSEIAAIDVAIVQAEAQLDRVAERLGYFEGRVTALRADEKRARYVAERYVNQTER